MKSVATLKYDRYYNAKRRRELKASHAPKKVKVIDLECGNPYYINYLEFRHYFKAYKRLKNIIVIYKDKIKINTTGVEYEQDGNNLRPIRVTDQNCNPR